MRNVSAPARQTAWARELAAVLAGQGVELVVVSPGSRSTPLVLALAEREDLTIKVVLDERAAGFFALGRSRLSGRPTALVCTSGSAGAHYHAAVVEACHARVPLLAITADRPPELHGRDAPQTIDQLGLFGRHVRASIELGAVPDRDEAIPASAEGLARALLATVWPEPGPVHVNVRFSKPFEPPAGQAPSPPPPRPGPRSHPARCEPAGDALDELAAAVRGCRSGLIVAGPAPPWRRDGLLRQAAAVAREAGLPLLAEAGSQLRFDGDREPRPRCDLFEPLLRCGWWEAQRPDLVLQLGAHPTSARWSRVWERLSGPRYVLAAQGWHDPPGGAAGRVLGDPERILAGLRERLGGDSGGRTDWLGHVAQAERVAREEADRLAGDGAPWSEASAVRTAVRSLPDGGLLQLANSLPVREVDALCEGPLADAVVLHQRGAMGIDGPIAGAAGAAAAAGRPLLAIVGDVAFAHDAGSLALLHETPTPLALLVLDNGGGRLFEALPIGQREDLREVFERCFLTPPGLDAAAVAAGFGLPVDDAADAAELRSALKAALEATDGGCRVVVARLAGTRGSEALQRELTSRVAARLDRGAEASP